VLVAVSAAQIAASSIVPGPSLLANPQRIANIQAAIPVDPVIADWVERMTQSADTYLTLPPLTPGWIDTDDGATAPIMLYTAREAVKRCTKLGLTWLLTGDTRYADRLYDEVMALCDFPDWEKPTIPPEVFLSVAEMGTAVALGADWLGDRLSRLERAHVVDALVIKLLQPGLRRHDIADLTRQGWPQWADNWNIVCNAGMVLGALYVGHDQPGLVTEVIARALNTVPIGFALYWPDGGWGEGVSYWAYATRFAAILIDAMECRGLAEHVQSLLDTPGFSTTGNVPLYGIAPSGVPFNFADCDDSVSRAPLGWTGMRFNRPVDIWQCRQKRDNSRIAFALLWLAGQGEGQSPAELQMPTHVTLQSSGMIVWRSSWTDENPVYLGFKGGDTRFRHAQLDLGSFVFEALGQRWAIDFGPDNYSTPGYFDPMLRWRNYRAGSGGHNVLTIGALGQVPESVAAILASDLGETIPRATVDVSQAYGGPAGSVLRGVEIDEGHILWVVDEIAATVQGPIVWSMHTEASVSIVDSTATLTLGGQTLMVHVFAPPGSVLVAEPATVPPGQNALPGVTVVTITVAPSAEPRSIAVALAPLETAPSADSVPNFKMA
jgi:hypothetical protein